MWNLAAGAGIAGVSAAYYALIRQNLELENRAIDDVAAEMFNKDKNQDAFGDVRGADHKDKLPSTASQNLMRKNFQLLSKQSGNIYGINVANTSTNKNVLAEKNNSDPELDRIVRRAECSSKYPKSQSTAAFIGAQRSKSDFGIGGNFGYQMYSSRSLFDVETSSNMEIPDKDDGQNEDNYAKVCHCKYSASSEDIHERRTTKQQIEIESDITLSNETEKEKSSEVISSQTTKKLHCSFLSEDYVPRLENREYGSSKIFSPTLKSAYRIKSPTKTDDKITQVIFHPNKEEELIEPNEDFEFNENVVPKSSIDQYIDEEVYSDDYADEFNTDIIHCEECGANGCCMDAASEKSSEYCEVAAFTPFESRIVAMTDPSPIVESEIPVQEKLRFYSRFTNKFIVEQATRLLSSSQRSSFGLLDNSWVTILRQTQDCVGSWVETLCRLTLLNPLLIIILTMVLTLSLSSYYFLTSTFITMEENENPADSVVEELVEVQPS